MEKTVSRKNSVRIVGYLKENQLELIKNSKGENIIKGSIIVATSDIDSHKVQFYVSEKDKNNNLNKDYEYLSKLLPENTLTIASYLKNNPTANFSVASSMSSKVWDVARFEEFVKRDKDNEKEISMVLLRGQKAGLKSSTETSPFVPGASFTVDAYIESLNPEKDADGKETGRLKVVTYIPTYDKSVQRIEFIAPTENNVASYIKGNYHPTDTVTLTGDVVSIAEIESKDTESSDFFGRSIDQKQYVTKFTRERIIYGGSKTPIKEGEEGSILTNDIRERLIVREEKIIEQTAKPRKVVRPVAEAEVKPAIPASDISDLDF